MILVTHGPKRPNGGSSNLAGLENYLPSKKTKQNEFLVKFLTQNGST